MTTVSRILSQWFPAHCAKGRFKLRSMLSDTDTKSIPELCPEARTIAGFRVCVETPVGRPVAIFQITEAATLADVKEQIEKCSPGPSFPAHRQRLYLAGHVQHGCLRNWVQRQKKSQLVKQWLRISQCVPLKDLVGAIYATAAASANSSVGEDASTSVHMNCRTNEAEAESVDGTNGGGGLQPGDNIDLVVTLLSTARWSESRSSEEVQFSESFKRAYRTESSNYVMDAYTAATVLLRDPGDYVSVRVAKVSNEGDEITLGLQDLNHESTDPYAFASTCWGDSAVTAFVRQGTKHGAAEAGAEAALEIDMLSAFGQRIPIQNTFWHQLTFKLTSHSVVVVADDDWSRQGMFVQQVPFPGAESKANLTLFALIPQGAAVEISDAVFKYVPEPWD